MKLKLNRQATPGHNWSVVFLNGGAALVTGAVWSVCVVKANCCNIGSANGKLHSHKQCSTTVRVRL